MSSVTEKSSWKSSIQKLGSQLSSMVMPNIGAFIAWGVLTALVIPTGYMPNEQLASMVGPMLQYLLPILIAFTGGSMVHGQRGGVVAAIATMGVIAGAGGTPMFIGAMMMAPLAAWLIKKFDQAFESKIPSGFEMLVNNFSAGLLGFFLAVLGFFAIGPVISAVTNFLAAGVDAIINMGLLPLANIFIEPAKILFLNNAINHGILTPIGTQQVESFGKSIVFLLEANPGPGLGVLLAFLVFGKGAAKSSSIGAIIIHFLGGIHEIYFPYVMMKPLMFFAVIAGGITGTFVNQLLGSALTAPASPGSIIAILGMAAKGSHFSVLMGVLASCLVAFLVGAIILKMDKSEDDTFEETKSQVQASKAESKGQSLNPSLPTINQIQSIVFACDAGMGSSAMGASLLKKKAKAMGLDVSIKNSAINQLKGDANTLVITQEELTDRAKKQAPNAHHVSVGNFLDGNRYDELLGNLVGQAMSDHPSSLEETSPSSILKSVTHIYLPYHETVGASTMAASQLRNKLLKANPNLTILAADIKEIDDKANYLIIAEPKLETQVRAKYQTAQILIWQDLLDESNYDAII